MSAWRTVFTDSESPTGVAPECERQGDKGHGIDDVGNCCPHPHIETYSEAGAKQLAALLTELDAGPCL